jgi:hypothetical protein
MEARSLKRLQVVDATSFHRLWRGRVTAESATTNGARRRARKTHPIALDD